MPKFIESTTCYQLPPPYRFSDVATHVFGLEADWQGLSAYCDKFLNGDGNPDWSSPYYFKPVAPFGFLCVAYYPAMEAVIPEYQPAGSWRQNEVYFTFPVVRYWKIGKLLLPLELNFAIPFIAVDEPGSAIVGREVLGLEKLVGAFEFSRRDGEGTVGPRNWQNLNISIEGTAALAPGSPGRNIKALEITLGDEDREFKGDRFPFADLRTELSLHAPNAKDNRDHLVSIPRVRAPGLLSTVTLKQFRDPVHVHRALYQALVGYDTKIEKPRPESGCWPVHYKTDHPTSIIVHKDNADLTLALAWANGSASIESGAKVVITPKFAYGFIAKEMLIDEFATVHVESGRPPDPRRAISEGLYSAGLNWRFGPFAGEGRVGLRSWK